MARRAIGSNKLSKNRMWFAKAWLYSKNQDYGYKVYARIGQTSFICQWCTFLTNQTGFNYVLIAMICILVLPMDCLVHFQLHWAVFSESVHHLNWA